MSTSSDTWNATPAKLRGGAWGARIASDTAVYVETGDAVRITTKAGKSWTATIDRVIAVDPCGKWAIVSTRSRPTSSSRRSSPLRRSGGAAAPVAGYSSWCTGRSGCGCYDCAS